MAMAFIREEDVAMVEHALLSTNDPFELAVDGEHYMYYVAGVHDMAKAMIDKVIGEDPATKEVE